MLTLVFLCCNVSLGIEKHILKRGFRKMKKLIAILAIMIVLVGAVFATDPVDTTPDGATQRVTIKSTVGRKDPTFLLKGLKDAGTFTNTGAQDAADVVDATTGNASAAGSYDGTLLTSAKDISQDDVVASFGVFQTADAKNKFAYSFTISATHLIQVTDANGDAPTTPYDAATPEFSNLGNTAWYASSTTGISAGTSSVDAASGITASVTFDGLATISADTTNPKLTFTVTWPKNRMAVAGDYEADVTMVLTVQ